MNTEENQKIWIEKVRENLILRGRSENTYSNYIYAIKKFFKYYSESTDLSSLSEEDIIPYLNENFIKINRSKYTYNLAVAAIRLFYIVCFRKSLNNILLPTSKIIKKLPTILPKDQFLKIINEEKHLKYRCWLILGFCSGLRVSEIAHIKVEDIYVSSNKLKVLGKGDKERFTRLPDISIKFLFSYCNKNNIKSGYIFKGTDNKPCINPDSITNYFSTIKKMYNLDNSISFHSLRHSFSTYYLASGGSLLTLQSMLGHSCLNTTTIYLHLSQNFNEFDEVKYV